MSLKQRRKRNSFVRKSREAKKAWDREMWHGLAAEAEGSERG